MIDGLYVIASSGTNELAHHGVKGMRWGVRRYQNSDGSLTPKGQKKVQRYRNKLAGKAKRRSDKGRRYAKEFNVEYRDLKKNGMKSDSWGKVVGERAKDSLNREGIVLGTMDSIAFGNSRAEFKTHMNEVRSKRNKWERYAKNWREKHKNLMNMPMDEFTTKKDVKNVYKNS